MQFLLKIMTMLESLKKKRLCSLYNIIVGGNNYALCFKHYLLYTNLLNDTPKQRCFLLISSAEKAVHILFQILLSCAKLSAKPHLSMI